MSATHLHHLAQLIGNDSHAATFQSLGQYRQALLKEIDQASAAPEQDAVAFRCKLSIHRDWKYIDHRSPDSYELRECQIEMLYTHPSAEIERLRAENNRLLSAGQALEADFSSYRREVERKAEAFIQRADAAEQKMAEAQALLRTAWKHMPSPEDSALDEFESAQLSAWHLETSAFLSATDQQGDQP